MYLEIILITGFYLAKILILIFRLYHVAINKKFFRQTIFN